MGRKKKSDHGLLGYFFIGIIAGALLLYYKEDVAKYKLSDFTKKFKNISLPKYSDPIPVIETADVQVDVPVRSIPPEPQPVYVSQPVIPVTPVAQPTPVDTIYAVQVASFKNYDQAKSYVTKLVDQEINAYVAPADVQAKKEWYRVVVGEYINKVDADQKAESLKTKFKDCFVRSL